MLSPSNMGRALRTITITGLVFVLLLSLGSIQNAQSETLMQCMQKCIRESGKLTDANKATCKTSCATAMFKANPSPSGMRDCMGEYKACRKECGKDKTCQRQCKKRQMSCN